MHKKLLGLHDIICHVCHLVTPDPLICFIAVNPPGRNPFTSLSLIRPFIWPPHTDNDFCRQPPTRLRLVAQWQLAGPQFHFKVPPEIKVSLLPCPCQGRKIDGKPQSDIFPVFHLVLAFICVQFSFQTIQILLKKGAPLSFFS